MDTSTVVAPAVEIPPRPTENPLDRIHLPVPKNRSQAGLFAKALFGPLARIKSDKDGFSVVYVERNRDRMDLAYGPDIHTALRQALLTVSESKDLARDYPNVISYRPARNVVEDQRLGLFIKLADEEADTVTALHPNEVLEIATAIRFRQYESESEQAKIDAHVKLITGPAKVRADEHKKKLAKLKAEMEALEAKMKAAQGSRPETNPSPVEPVEAAK